MCGISGYISRSSMYEQNIDKTLKLMSSRGPDNNNFISYRTPTKQIYLLHSRLNIIDLKERSNQPMKIGEFTIIFNGEIYNYLEVRKQLEKKYKFKTQSDTEVLLYSFIEYGEKFHKILDGMWSFAIWDEKNNNLFLSRDPFGEKPLYYTFYNNSFFFGSEIKYLFSLSNKKKDINDEKINNFLFNGYKSIYHDNDTFFRGIKELPSGTLLKIKDNNIHKIKKYFGYRKNINENKNTNLNEIIKKNRECLIENVEFRMRADVPLAFCLSGGIDSGSLVSIASKVLNKKVSCFSIIDQDERYNELKNIKKIVKDCNADHFLIFLKDKKKNFFEKLDNLIEYHDSPLSTISYFIHSYLLEDISKNNFKVSISGTGADELYTGYYDHYNQYFGSVNANNKFYKENLQYWKKFIKPNLRNEALKNINFYKKNPKSVSNVFEKNFSLEKFAQKKTNLIKIKQKKFSEDILRNRMLNEIFHEIVPVILKHDDHNSMMHSVENRSPYLSKNLFNLTNKIPSELLIQNGYQKFILRESMSGILIDSVRLDRKKKGFNADLASLIDLKNKKNIEMIFNRNNLINEFVNLDFLSKSINYSKLPNHFSKFLFSVINVNIFLNKNS